MFEEFVVNFFKKKIKIISDEWQFQKYFLSRFVAQYFDKFLIFIEEICGYNSSIKS